VNPVATDYWAATEPAADQRRRLELLEARYDPLTFRRLDAVGVAPGWACLEVGAGAGSVARWLAARVGTTGHVVATDLDPRFLGGDLGAAVTVRRHDIRTDALEEAAFDLVHCRALLCHLNDPAAALTRMAAAVRPGGWLLVEDADYATFDAACPNHPLSPAWAGAALRLACSLAANGVIDPRFGRRLPALLSDLGLVDRGHEGSCGSTAARPRPPNFSGTASIRSGPGGSNGSTCPTPISPPSALPSPTRPSPLSRRSATAPGAAVPADPGAAAPPSVRGSQRQAIFNGCGAPNLPRVSSRRRSSGRASLPGVGMKRWAWLAVATACIVLGGSGVAARADSGDEAKLSATLSAAEEVPSPGPAGGEGNALLKPDPDEHRLCYRLRYSGIGKPTGGWVQQGPKGAPGPVEIDLHVADHGDSGCVDADQALLESIISNPSSHYVNVATPQYPNGAIRGQLGQSS